MKVYCLASGSSGNSYAVDDVESVLLLEAGLPARRIMQGYLDLLPRCAGCLITHEHQDHATGAASLCSRGIDLYMTAGTQHALGGFKCPSKIVVTVNKTMIVNDAETVNMIMQSRGLVPDNILLAHHPLVDDAEQAEKTSKLNRRNRTRGENRCSETMTCRRTVIPDELR